VYASQSERKQINVSEHNDTANIVARTTIDDLYVRWSNSFLPQTLRWRDQSDLHEDQANSISMPSEL
jgi:hypothetical protein